MLKKTFLISLLSTASFLGFITGLSFTIAESISHNYFYYKLYYLFALASQTNLNIWIITANAIFLFAGIVYIISKRTLSLWLKKDQTLNLLTAFIVCFCLLLISKWMIPIYLTGELKQHIFFVDIVWILSLILLGIILYSTLLSKVISSKFMKLLYWLSPVVVFIWLSLNAGVYLYKHFRQPEGPNVIFIISDALRPDHLSAYGYHRQTSPTIEKLANQGIVFDRMYSNFTWTKPSIASLFTSLYDEPQALTGSFDIMPNSMLTMAEIFKNNNYFTIFINAGNYFIDDDFNYDQGFKKYIYFDAPAHEPVIKAELIIDQLLENISKHKNKKIFSYIHLMDTHLPYHKNSFNKFYSKNTSEILEPGKINLYRLRKLSPKEIGEKNIRQDLIDLYDGQIRYIDKNIKKLLSGLKKLNVLDNTIIIISADHGEEFWEHGQIGHGNVLSEKTIRIPFIIWGANIKDKRYKPKAWLCDALPTILGLAHISTPVDFFQGKDIFKNNTKQKMLTDTPAHKFDDKTPRKLEKIDKEKIEKLKALGYM